MALLITLSATAALLLWLLPPLMTAAYSARVPGGADAMGLFVPFACAILGALLMLAAAIASVCIGDFEWLSPRRGTAAWIVLPVVFGLGCAAFGVLVAWAERMGGWVPALGWIPGFIAPLVLYLMLVSGTWSEVARADLQALLKGGMLLLVLVALAGYGLLAQGTRSWMRQEADNARRSLEAAQLREAEWARKRARTPIEAVREDFAGYSDTAPLWTVIAGLPDTDDSEVRAFIIERAFRVPGLDAELERTLSSPHPRYRHGCLDFVRFAPDARLRAAWAPMVARAIALSAAQIRENPNWMIADAFANPDPVEHVHAMVDAARRFADPEPLHASLADLRQALEHVPGDPMGDRPPTW